MSKRSTSRYGQLVQKSDPPSAPSRRAPEEELDALLNTMKEREQQTQGGPSGASPDPIERLREMMTAELVPAFVELVEKYSPAGISMKMDASSLLEGGREVKFEFSIGDCRMELNGTVTPEAIAFHETRYTPEVPGELVSGPMLRVRGLDATAFRAFVCERLAILLKANMRRR